MLGTWSGLLCTGERWTLSVFDGGLVNLGHAYRMWFYQARSSFSNTCSPQSQHLATLETPLDKLKLADKCIRQSQLKKCTTSQPPLSQLLAPLLAQPTITPTAAQSPDIMQMMMMMLGTAVTAFASNSGARDCPRARQSLDGYSSSSSPPLPHAVVPSKRPKSVVYLELKDWLKDLEANPFRNKYGKPFLKY